MAEQLGIMSIFKFKVDELKQELGKRGLAKSGSKADLQERLLQYVSRVNESVISSNSCAGDDKTHGDLDAVAPQNEPLIEDVEINDPAIEDVELNDPAIDDAELNDPSIEDAELNEPAIEDAELNELLEDKAENLLESLDKSDPLEDKPENKLENDIITKPFANTDLIKKNSDNVDDNGKNEGNVELLENSLLNVEDKSKDDIFWGNSKETFINEKDETVEKKESVPKISRVKITFSSDSNIDKKGDRSKRFGEVSSETEKKKARMDRFSSTGMGKGEPITEDDVEKIKKRAERFGAISTVLTNPNSQGKLEQRRERFADSTLKKRQERFGIVQNTSSVISNTDSEKKNLRAAKFGAV